MKTKIREMFLAKPPIGSKVRSLRWKGNAMQCKEIDIHGKSRLCKIVGRRNVRDVVRAGKYPKQIGDQEALKNSII